MPPREGPSVPTNETTQRRCGSTQESRCAIGELLKARILILSLPIDHKWSHYAGWRKRSIQCPMNDYLITVIPLGQAVASKLVSAGLGTFLFGGEPEQWSFLTTDAVSKECIWVGSLCAFTSSRGALKHDVGLVSNSKISKGSCTDLVVHSFPTSSPS